MISLKTEPAGPVRSLEEFFALAHAMETDAACRYTEAAEQLRQQGASDLADLFDRLAEVEKGHVGEVARWAVHRGEKSAIGNRPPWPIPDTFDAAPGEMAQSRLLTPYRALASAVRHEERSFAFWSYISAHADRSEVREAAERMALEELEHVSLLRRERRRAFYAERRNGKDKRPRTTLAALAAKEQHMAELIAQRPELCQGHDELARTIAAASNDAASRLIALKAARHAAVPLPEFPADMADDPLAIAEFLVEAYLTLADLSKDATLVRAAQELAGPAIYRLAALRSRSDWGVETEKAADAR
jgi:rubrerythrin